MEQKIDDRDFVDVQDFAEVLESLAAVTPGARWRGARLVGGDGTTFSRAALVERTLTDGSTVLDLRLS